MKISTDNGTIRNAFGDAEAIRMIAQAGFDGIDYTFYDTAPKYDLLRLNDQERYASAMYIHEMADHYNIVFPQAHAPFQYKYGEDRRGDHYQDVVKSLELSAWLGCKQIVIHTLSFSNSEMTEEQSNEINREFLLSFLPVAEKLDIYIGVENLFRYDTKRHCFIGHHETPQKMNAFVDSLNSHRYRVCCDLGHAAISGVEPEQFISGMTNDRLTMTHIQDTDYISDTHTIPYMGKQNWERVTDALAQIDYQGFINLEVLHYYEQFPLDLLPNALKLAACTSRHLAKMVDEKRYNASFNNDTGMV